MDKIVVKIVLIVMGVLIVLLAGANAVRGISSLIGDNVETIGKDDVIDVRENTSVSLSSCDFFQLSPRVFREDAGLIQATPEEQVDFDWRCSQRYVVLDLKLDAGLVYEVTIGDEINIAADKNTLYIRRDGLLLGGLIFIIASIVSSYLWTLGIWIKKIE